MDKIITLNNIIRLSDFCHKYPNMPVKPALILGAGHSLNKYDLTNFNGVSFMVLNVMTKVRQIIDNTKFYFIM